MELAGFQDRRTQNAEAIATYHQALTLDSRVTRARLELCRLYSPNRTNEPVRAKAEGEQALNTYRRLGDKAGEAQALFCLVDVLRVGSAAERAQALTYATSALEILDSIGHEYNWARAENYVALIAGSGGDMPAAVTHWERALAGARATGNRLLTPRVLQQSRRRLPGARRSRARRRVVPSKLCVERGARRSTGGGAHTRQCRRDPDRVRQHRGRPPRRAECAAGRREPHR